MQAGHVSNKIFLQFSLPPIDDLYLCNKLIIIKASTCGVIKKTIY